MSISISVIIPTRMESKNSYLLKFAEKYPQIPSLEYLVVDSGTELSTLNQIQRDDFKVFNLPNSTRAARLNYGVTKAQGHLILCHHPRSYIEGAGLYFLAENFQKLRWGGFTHQFDKKSLGLSWTSFYSNKIRPKWSQVLYLDHCIFFRKELLAKPIPDIPIFEDTELSKLLKKSGAPQVLPYISETSSVRFEKNGFLKQAFINQLLKLGYHLGISPKKMNELYEKKLNLN